MIRYINLNNFSAQAWNTIDFVSTYPIHTNVNIEQVYGINGQYDIYTDINKTLKIGSHHVLNFNSYRDYIPYQRTNPYYPYVVAQCTITGSYAPGMLIKSAQQQYRLNSFTINKTFNRRNQFNCKPVLFRVWVDAPDSTDRTSLSFTPQYSTGWMSYTVKESPLFLQWTSSFSNAAGDVRYYDNYKRILVSSPYQENCSISYMNWGVDFTCDEYDISHYSDGSERILPLTHLKEYKPPVISVVNNSGTGFNSNQITVTNPNNVSIHLYIMTKEYKISEIQKWKLEQWGGTAPTMQLIEYTLTPNGTYTTTYQQSSTSEAIGCSFIVNNTRYISWTKIVRKGTSSTTGSTRIAA